jgi:toxin ParE1/3/4
VIYKVVWEQSARIDLLALYDWIADRADPDTAYRYTSRIEAFVETLRSFPNRGTPRDRVSPGLRSITFERKYIIGYCVEEDEVVILRIIHGARDFAKTFRG